MRPRMRREPWTSKCLIFARYLAWWDLPTSRSFMRIDREWAGRQRNWLPKRPFSSCRRLSGTSPRNSPLESMPQHLQTVEPSLAGGFGGYVANSEDRRAQRSGAASHPDLPRGRRRLHARDVSGLEPLGTLGQLEFHGLALIQALVSTFLDRGKMYKYVLAGRALNETIALGPVEPFNCAFFFHNLPLSHGIPEITPASRKFPAPP